MSEPSRAAHPERHPAVAASRGRYYADGRTVHKAPVEKTGEDGKRSVSLGFPVCEIGELLKDEAAELVAAALNLACYGDPLPEELRDAD